MSTYVKTVEAIEFKVSDKEKEQVAAKQVVTHEGLGCQIRKDGDEHFCMVPVKTQVVRVSEGDIVEMEKGVPVAVHTAEAFHAVHTEVVVEETPAEGEGTPAE